MCTLSFIPVSDTDFIFTINRDEDPNRVALSPQKYSHSCLDLFYPKDSKAKGSWIISNYVDTSLCLLNGAFEKHQRQPNYRQSRGLVLLDFFRYSNLADFIENYQFNGIEAFTLIVLDSKYGMCLSELIWDEQELHVKELSSSKAHIWSSTTLYTNPMKSEREQWFWDWLRIEKHVNSDSILKFHKIGGEGNLEFGLLMNRRNLVKTVSITQIFGSGNTHRMKYYDLLDNEI